MYFVFCDGTIRRGDSPPLALETPDSETLDMPEASLRGLREGLETASVRIHLNRLRAGDLDMAGYYRRHHRKWLPRKEIAGKQANI